jgi:hypothetical protein
MTKTSVAVPLWPGVAPGAGHYSIDKRPGRDEYVMMYNRPARGGTDANDRVGCFDRPEFGGEGPIRPVTMTTPGER